MECAQDFQVTVMRFLFHIHHHAYNNRSQFINPWYKNIDLTKNKMPSIVLYKNNMENAQTTHYPTKRSLLLTWDFLDKLSL